ncbi:MAG TPA: hypothetical protein VNR89_02515 [Roseomonas sp.]|nr:hypothetical protein [Roseomonas sp.]
MVQRHLLPETRSAQPSRLARGARRGLAGLLMLSTLCASTGALAAPFRCTSEEQQKMFEISALKTELMVVATTCDTEDAYNAFITRYQPVLSSNDHSVISHFTSRDRRAGQKANDTFITNLANARAQEANRVGADFCARNAVLFKEVMSLPSAAELAPYAAAKDLLPASMGSCVPSAATPAAPAKAARTPVRRASR